MMPIVIAENFNGGQAAAEPDGLALLFQISLPILFQFCGAAPLRPPQAFARA